LKKIYYIIFTHTIIMFRKFTQLETTGIWWSNCIRTHFETRFTWS